MVGSGFVGDELAADCWGCESINEIGGELFSVGKERFGDVGGFCRLSLSRGFEDENMEMGGEVDGTDGEFGDMN